MPQIDLAGESLGYGVRGPAGGRDVLLVHGTGGDHRHWPAALAPLPGVRLAWLGLPGRGRSGGRGCTSAEAPADVLAHVVGARLGELRVPTLVITGSADAMTPPKYAEARAGFLARLEA